MSCLQTTNGYFVGSIEGQKNMITFRQSYLAFLEYIIFKYVQILLKFMFSTKATKFLRKTNGQGSKDYKIMSLLASAHRLITPKPVIT